MKVQLKKLMLALVCPFMMAPAFAETPSSVFITGEVIKGNALVTNFATPIIIGNSFPLKDQSTQGLLESRVYLTVTPTQVTGTKLIVKVAGNLSETPRFAKLQGAAITNAGEATKLAKKSFSTQVEMTPGQQQTISLGDCTPAEANASICTYKLVLKAQQ